MPILDCGCVYDGTNVVFRKCEKHTDEALLGSVGLLLPFHWCEGLKPVATGTNPGGGLRDPKEELRGLVEIHGVEHVVVCWEVEEYEDGLRAKDARGMIGGRTVKINGRDYWLEIRPQTR